MIFNLFQSLYDIQHLSLTLLLTVLFYSDWRVWSGCLWYMNGRFRCLMIFDIGVNLSGAVKFWLIIVDYFTDLSFALNLYSLCSVIPNEDWWAVIVLSLIRLIWGLVLILIGCSSGECLFIIGKGRAGSKIILYVCVFLHWYRITNLFRQMIINRNFDKKE